MTARLTGSLREKVGDVVGRPRRWRLLEQMPKGAVCAEIGVFNGDFSRHILRVTKPRELHLIDGWWTVQGDNYEHGWYSAAGVPSGPSKRTSKRTPGSNGRSLERSR
jgi:hypothetical protein